MRAALGAVALCATAASADQGWPVPSGELTDAVVGAHFAQFKSRFGKAYPTAAEEAHRRDVFRANMEWVRANAPETHGNTQFSDMTEAEFRAAYLHNASPEEEAEEARARAERPKWDGECHACKRFPEMADYRAESLDWSTKGAVTKVKNQEQCDSCYAFGATGDIEGSWFLSGQTLVSLSEQELVSCVGKYNNGTKKGCGGGSRSKQYRWVIDNGGITTEANYPYTSGAGIIVGTPKCKPEKEKPIAATIDSFLQVSSSADEEQKLFDAVNKLGPISIGISAVRMELYMGGIMGGVCAQKHDHAPLIVGYGTANGKDYWKIKNSWGGGWGERGYFRAVRMKNTCGLATDAVHTKVGGGKRYHCHMETYQCAEADKGYSTLDNCHDACHKPGPTGPPTPAPPVAPTPPPTPAGPRYHCVNESYQCFEVPPNTAPGGHISLDVCEKACFAPGYMCNTTTQQCYGVATGGDKLHTCRDQCNSPPTPIPVWTPAPVQVRYHCKDGLFGKKCVEDTEGHSTMEKCQESCS